MKIECIDLHIHTTASDGSLTTLEVIKNASDTGLKAISITDHNTIDGLTNIEKYAQLYQLEVIPGIELSVDWRTDIHILGYFIDIHSNELKNDLNKIKISQLKKIKDIFRKLRHKGIEISPNEIEKQYGDISKESISLYLVNRGYVKNVSEATMMFIEENGDDLKSSILSPYQAIEIIKKAKGLAFLAHPSSLDMSNGQLEKFVADLANHGLDGMECIHTNCTTLNQKYFFELSRKFGLLKSGGSDFHGDIRPNVKIGKGYGTLVIPYELLKKMKTYYNKTTRT